jgi:hypothetical protein
MDECIFCAQLDGDHSVCAQKDKDDHITISIRDNAKVQKLIEENPQLVEDILKEIKKLRSSN